MAHPSHSSCLWSSSVEARSLRAQTMDLLDSKFHQWLSPTSPSFPWSLLGSDDGFPTGAPLLTSTPLPLCTVISLMESWFQVIVHPLPTRNAPEGSCHLQTNFPFSPCHSKTLGILPCGFLRSKFNHPSYPRVCKKRKKIICSGHTGLWVL